MSQTTRERPRLTDREFRLRAPFLPGNLSLPPTLTPDNVRSSSHSHSIISQLLKLLFRRAPAHRSRLSTVTYTAETGRWSAIDSDRNRKQILLISWSFQFARRALKRFTVSASRLSLRAQAFWTKSLCGWVAAFRRLKICRDARTLPASFGHK